MQNSTNQVETPENRRKRLKFRAWHRGTRELDLLLGSFADKHLPDFTDAQLDQFEAIIENNDPDLYNWVSGHEPPPEAEKSEVLTLLLQHRFAT